MLKIAIYIQPHTIEYSKNVAHSIVDKLSFDMDTIDTWNIDQAPNEQQLRHFVKENRKSILAKMTQTQRENLFKWMLRGEIYGD